MYISCLRPFVLCVQGTPVDVLAKALYTSDTKLQLAATSKFRKILSVFGELIAQKQCLVLKANGPPLWSYFKMSALLPEVLVYHSHW